MIFTTTYEYEDIYAQEMHNIIGYKSYLFKSQVITHILKIGYQNSPNIQLTLLIQGARGGKISLY